MTKKSESENFIQVKRELAEKHERRARNRRSKPARKVLLHQAERFRSQALNAAKGESE